jgi:hypothetical protein
VEREVWNADKGLEVHMSPREGDEAEVCALGNDNLLLAGTVLKVGKDLTQLDQIHITFDRINNHILQNTREVYACCVYAGTQTKISLNSKITKNKFSSIERTLNK